MIQWKFWTDDGTSVKVTGSSTVNPVGLGEEAGTCTYQLFVRIVGYRQTSKGRHSQAELHTKAEAVIIHIL